MEPIGEQLSDLLEAASMERMSPGLSVLWAVLDILGGITLIWVYAAVRPRLGAGPKTAAIVGLTVWWIALLANMFYIAAGLVPLSTFTIPALYSLVAMVLATISGAWIYQEESG